MPQQAHKPHPWAIPPQLPFDYVRVDMGIGLQLLNNMIRHRGAPVQLTPSLVCPCVVPTREGGRGDAIPDCPACSGTGLAYAEDKVIEVRAVISGAGARDDHMQQGQLTTGTVNITFPSDVVVGEGDRVHLAQTYVQVRHNRKYRKSVGGIHLPFKVADVRLVATQDPGTGNLVTLERGRDYSLDVDRGWMMFPDDSPVRDGAVVSGVFVMTPYYLIENMTSAFRGQFSRYFSPNGQDIWTKAPQSCTAVRADILFARFERDISMRGSAEYGEGS